jgi:hypothetical protein
MAQTKQTDVKKECDQCKTQSASLKRCSRCQTSYYCNVTCQRQHYPTHKKVCIPTWMKQDPKKLDSEAKEKLNEKWAAWTIYELPKMIDKHLHLREKPMIDNVQWVKENKTKIDEYVLNETKNADLQVTIADKGAVIEQAITKFHPYDRGLAHPYPPLLKLSGKMEEDVKFAESIVIYIGDILAANHLRFSSNGWINESNTGIGNAAYFALHSKNSVIREKFKLIYQQLYEERVQTKDMSCGRYFVRDKNKDID